ncbi:MAG: FHA domain-containing protein [Desulfobulbaceae bacterium]|nr:FHA domain-containing protein [Desulfobulbaceae bacterium]
MAEWAILSKNRVIKRFNIEEGQCLAIGRGDNADVIVNNSSVSRKHISLELNKGFYYLSDLNSMNGTRVNGEKINSERQIFESDNISIGKFNLKISKLLTDDEVEAGSVAADGMNMESHNQTLYVTGIHKTGKKETTAPKNRLSVLQGYGTPAKLILRGKTITVGKDPSANLVLAGALTAKCAFTIEYRPNDGYFVIARQGMFNKVMVNGRTVDKGKRLKPMDIIEVGKTKIRFT